MGLRKLAKDLESGKHGCPTVYVDDDGTLVVQGDLLSAATESQLENVLPGEGAVRIKADTVQAALQRYHHGTSS